MDTRESLILRALQFKELHVRGSSNPGGLIDRLMEQNPEHADAITKNVCARIPIEMATEMEQLGGLLSINKRELITMAIQDFLAKANGVMDEFDAWPREEEGSK